MNRLCISPSLTLTRHLPHHHHSGKYPPAAAAAFFNKLSSLPLNSCFSQFCYLLSLSLVGYCILNSLNTRPTGTASDDIPGTLDYFFTSISATTGSSMASVEMEVFSDSQLLLITFLMFLGGEVFTSLLGLVIKNYKMRKEVTRLVSASNNDGKNEPTPFNPRYELELRAVVILPAHHQNHHHNNTTTKEDWSEVHLKRKSIQFLCYVTLTYLTSIHVLGISSLSLYLALEPSARNVLREKGLGTFTFSLFTVVSTFTNCGFLPTNENMIPFGRNPGMLLLLIPHVLLGNTLSPSCIRLCVWLAGKLFPKNNAEHYSKFLLEVKRDGVTNGILLPGRHSAYLAATVAGLVAVQFVMFCGLDWDSEGMKGLNPVQKLVGGAFMAVNSRHAGESIVDLSTISPAVLVVFVAMMYLPPYTSFLPTEREREEEQEDRNSRDNNIIIQNSNTTGEKRAGNIVENVIFSQLSFLVVFVVMVCITERESLKKDPLNFNVFTIAFEVVSAYGNVGYSIGYSCKRCINPVENCQDKWISFSGKWSNQGKIVLILVMLFGKLKKFNVNGGKAWKLL
ncbi:unnamed protein product [Linum tenue]|uniref:Uncharacterized protein n=1 Tax=Linum tenue TaxID=586396 RepID=A0AAV0S4G8_9ROSI|nr:unnamed protein product [Linum tenue]